MTATLAKRKLEMLEPTWCTHPEYVQTFGPEVASVAAAAGLVPDPEQEMLLDLLFAIDAQHRAAVFEFDLIAARQNLKTAFILMSEIGWLYVTDERLVVHSAHELDTTQEAFNDMKALITNTPALSRRLKPDRSEGIKEGNGRWQIELTNGQRLRYKARTKGGGRGLTGNKVVLDEGFALQPSHMGALLPTLSAVIDPQVLTASSAGKVESAVLRDKRDRGRAGLTERQAYVEWGDRDEWTGCTSAKCKHEKTAEGCALDNEKRWARTNPALGRRITLATLRSMRQAMPPEEFAREFLVWWDPTDGEGTGSIDLKAWSAGLDSTAPRLKHACVSVVVSPGMGQSTIAVAGRHESGRTLVMVRQLEGVGKVPKALRKIEKRAIVEEVALASGDQTRSLEGALTKAEIDFEKLSSADVGQACAWLVAAANEGKIAHVGQTELDQAISRAKPATGLTERFAADPDVDVIPATAAAIAAQRWAAYDSTDYDVEDSFL